MQGEVDKLDTEDQLQYTSIEKKLKGTTNPTQKQGKAKNLFLPAVVLYKPQHLRNNKS